MYTGAVYERAWEPQIGVLSRRHKNDNDFLLLAVPEGNRAKHLVDGLRVVLEFCVPPLSLDYKNDVVCLR